MYMEIRTPAMGAVNWIGLWTLYLREVRRFVKVYTQTLIAPVVTTLLFLAVFALALGGSVRTVAGIPFMEFLAPGLIVMSIVQNAFANTSSSIVISKIQGNIIDTLMPPFTAHELTFDHVIPRSRGGHTTWTNVVTACSGCNLGKANKIPRESGMHPLTRPQPPSTQQLQRNGRGFPPNFLHASWRDFLYWDTELDAV